ncbi:MAG: hypothetical protein NW237_14630 [Cyanobacteriota bacterium]|nr:hypothetical protein [Cyanobacteriota bacterium]
MNIYHLVPDVSRYRSLVVGSGEKLNKVSKFLSGNPVLGIWEPVPVQLVSDLDKPPRLISDFPGLSGMPAFTEKAVEALGEVLEMNGELLPLESDNGTFYLYNTTTIVDALDEEKSSLSKNQNGLVYYIKKYYFIPQKVSQLTIFKTVQIPHDSYPCVTDQFVNIVERARLTGFLFRKIWSSDEE